MEIFRWTVFLCSLIFGIAWLLAGVFLTLVLGSLAISRPQIRSFMIMFLSFVLGGVSFAHMLMVPIQVAAGVPERFYAKFLFSGVSFGDLVTGKFSFLETGAALCGLLSAVVGGWFIIGRITGLVSQLANIPTSKAGSAAMGLAEFSGTVRPADDRNVDIFWSLAHVPDEDIIDGGDTDLPPEYILVDEKRLVTYRHGNTIRTEPAMLRKWSSFYLEDSSGRILVDPGQVDFGEVSISPFSMSDSQMICLENNWEATRHRNGSRTFLKPGDRVYVIGTVQLNREAPPDAKDSERLVVRPLSVTGKRGFHEMKDSLLVSGMMTDIFILTDDTETDIAEAMRSWKKPVFMAACVLLVTSLLYLSCYLK